MAIGWIAAVVAVFAGSALLARDWLLLWAVALILQVFAVVPIRWHATRRKRLPWGSIALAFGMAAGGVSGMGS
jgi:hypothetical protein